MFFCGSATTWTPGQIHWRSAPESVPRTANYVEFLLHYGANDWSRAQVNGLTAQLAVMGIEFIAITGDGFRSEKQIADIEAVLA